jgi:DNA transformation protein
VRTSPEFAAHCLDLFAGLGPVEARAMFGGHAFFAGAAMIAIGDADDWRLWLKVDGATRPRFEAAGGEPFTYRSHGGRTTALGFFTVPDGAMEDGEAMLPWARLALEAAERALAARRKRTGGVAKARPKAAGKPAAPRRRATRR